MKIRTKDSIEELQDIDAFVISSNEVKQLIAEMVTLYESKGDCDLTIFGIPIELEGI